MRVPFPIPAVVVAFATVASSPVVGQRPGTIALGAFARFTHFDPSLFGCFLDLLPHFRRIRQQFEGWET